MCENQIYFESDLNEQQYLKRFVLVKMVPNSLLVAKAMGEIKPLCIMVPKVSGYVNILMNLNTYLNKILDKNGNINKKT